MLNEAHHSEVEKVLLYISEARERAERARCARIPWSSRRAWRAFTLTSRLDDASTRHSSEWWSRRRAPPRRAAPQPSSVSSNPHLPRRMSG
jgi:hypothetical protein